MEKVNKQNEDLAGATALGQIILGELDKAPNKEELLSGTTNDDFVKARMEIYWERYFLIFDENKNHFLAQESALEIALSCFASEPESEN